MKNFVDLEAWKRAHAFVLSIYTLTRTFQTEERFGLVSQMRRAAVSITSSIAEGFGRMAPRDKLRFYSIACGSLVEVQNQIMIARDVGYVRDEQHISCLSASENVYQIMNGLIRSIKKRL